VCLGLSAEQMTTLTTSIVLLVEVEVIGSDGKPVKVLSPRVYLASVDSRDISGAAVIAGSNVRLRTADALANSGVIRASATSIIDAGSIANRGTIDFGQTGFARTAGDFGSRGAIRGGDRSQSRRDARRHGRSRDRRWRHLLGQRLRDQRRRQYVGFRGHARPLGERSQVAGQ